MSSATADDTEWPLEVMNNPAAARTFNILAGEGRKVAAAFILEG